MRVVDLESPTDLDGWRKAARALAEAGVPPGEIVWRVGGESDLLGAAAEPFKAGPASFTVPSAFMELAQTIILHRDPQKFAWLYELLLQLRMNRHAMADSVSPLMTRLNAMAKAIRRDIHKMRAFVRFREIETPDGPSFLAWFEPDHYIVAANTPFFVRRFGAMRWAIVTPECTASWDGTELTFAPGGERADVPAEDAMEEAWRIYYASIFNPARLKVNAMRAEMPRKYWRNLPEASLISPLVSEATRRMQHMVAHAPSPPKQNPQKLTPIIEDAAAAPAGSLDALRAEAAGCRACPLWQPATQTVFGEGPNDASVVFVGEQPGDKEDLAGRPFVGPAGQLLDKAMTEAGVIRERIYVTNAVKHFKFTPRGRIRLHQKPDVGEISACRPWLEKELDLIQPELVVALGATAAHALFGKATSISSVRGRIVDLGERRRAFVTVHPSYLLRLPDEAAKAAEYARFVDDLRAVANFLRDREAA